MAVTWTKVYTMGYRAGQLVEYEASHVDEMSGPVTVRPIGNTGSKGSTQYQRHVFVQRFSTTKADTIDKYIAEQRSLIGNAEAKIKLAQLEIERAEQLKEKL